MHTLVQPNTYIALRLLSDNLKVLQIVPHTVISIGKYGSFPANSLLGRPYNVTYEILDRSSDRDARLRIVPAAELHADTIATKHAVEEDEGRIVDGGDGVEYELIGEDGEVVMRTNREIVDDPGRQALSAEEIETLKREGTGAGKDLISQLLLSHSALSQKSSFSLAKYTLRKTKKYMRRFTVLPLDVPTVTRWLLTEKEPPKILELQEEMLSLMGSWANVHYGGLSRAAESEEMNIEGPRSRGRWLVVDETGGLVVAALAERMGILYPEEAAVASASAEPSTIGSNTHDASPPHRHDHRNHIPAMSANHTSLTLIHANTQPNLALLRYFSFDSNTPSPSHPLYEHLKSLSWLQLLAPEEDPGYVEPEPVPNETLKTWKSGKRGAYFRKRRRWERVKGVVDEARAGGFDGLVVASVMTPASILHHAIPLLRGGAPLVVYSPHVEPLAELADCYSTSRKTAFLAKPPDPTGLPNDDFALDPTLVLGPTVQTTRLRRWQCLPGRTHPLMMSRGGAEGYLFTATRVLPAKGKVEARGKYKRRKTTRAESDGAREQSEFSSKDEIEQ